MMLQNMPRIAISSLLFFFTTSLAAIEYLLIDKVRSSDELLNQIISSPQSQKPFGLTIEFERTDKRTAILNDALAQLVQLHQSIADNLVELNLSSNQLGEFPSSIGGLHNLKNLNLNDNQLHEIPRIALSNLKSLSLASNKLKQAPDITGLVQLHYLDLGGNPLSQLVILPYLLRDQLEIVGVPARLFQYERPPQQPLVRDSSKLPELKRLVQHMHVMQELKSLKKEALHSSGRFALRLPVEKPTAPTDAWFKYFNVQFPRSTKLNATQHSPWMAEPANRLIVDMRKKRAFKKVFAQAIQRERTLAETHFPFYHANDTKSEAYFDTIAYAIGLAYILKESPAGLKLRIPQRLHQAEVPLTQWYQDNFKDSKATDHWPHLQEALLATNVSLFGNMHENFNGECSWKFFAYAQSHNPIVSRKIATNIAELFGVEAHDPLCYNLEEKLDAFIRSLNRVHSLHQIFIAKDSVGKHVVLTKAYGSPYRANQILFRAPAAENFPDVRMILQRYIDDFDSLTAANNIQARIRFTPELILNDTDDIIHYTYHVPEDIFEQPEIAKARAEVHQVIQNMLIKSLDNPSNSPLTTATRLQQLIEQADQQQAALPTYTS